MLRFLALVLPALIPSWRFFKSVEPSPRIQWCLDPIGPREHWHEFRPRPQRLSAVQRLTRLFWNPTWNEILYLVSCAERIQQDPTEHSIREIRHRIWAALAHDGAMPSTPDCVRFRLVFVHDDGDALTQEVVFQSDRAGYNTGVTG